MDIFKLLEKTIEMKASDLHLVVGMPPMLRIEGALTPIESKPVTDEDAQQLVFALLTSEQKDLFLVNRELDFSYDHEGKGRFRVNVYHQKGFVSAALRLIPSEIKSIEDLNLPKLYHSFANLRQGFILVTGPTGHGKSTTLASIIQEINETRSVHVVTVEDPIEYVYPIGSSVVSQRELHADTHSWEIALRSVLREDPDVVLVGEMRDYETIAAALTIAETGHLVFATLHTNSAAQTIDRIVDVFPEHQQGQIRLQLSNTLEAVLSQRLLPAVSGGRLPVAEILLATPAVRTTIREGKTHLIDNVIQTSADIGMQTLETNMSFWVRSGKLSLETAMEWAIRPGELRRLVRRGKE
ncbi:MAG: type IV pili twitching motility protein PilT [Candidatus Chisholmbacteria bacterium RIFCSPLOWO2_01_FULL_49_14]|uniref:Type IV pili twitching motility protein PilT n=1 Tax=Candidatus Chisholmbacteria bacterium RIFCSPLOWO2_01_FULL_49_14 TaxID=1797593 RepID=A0A1G1VZ12_9BACT|nr:MAG: type IV pili twitching motility protein PilT [Candidatus Chisholmbacteria bacterium RIFCSPLOWO2_01_FULL_49_14]